MRKQHKLASWPEHGSIGKIHLMRPCTVDSSAVMATRKNSAVLSYPSHSMTGQERLGRINDEPLYRLLGLAEAALVFQVFFPLTSPQIRELFLCS